MYRWSEYVFGNPNSNRILSSPFEKLAQVNSNILRGTPTSHHLGSIIRRLTDKKSPDDTKESSTSVATATTTDNNSRSKLAPGKKAPRTARRVRRRQTDQYDGQGLMLWQAGREIKNSNKSHLYIPTNHRGTLKATHSLPKLNASSLLDSKNYCVKSASASTTRSGAEAARRLLRGKRDLVSVVRNNLWGSPPLPFSALVLQHHGLPPELLQDHVNWADALLTKHSANAISLQDYRETVSDKYAIAMRVRGHDGQSQPFRAIPPGAGNPGSHAPNSMELYLTAMNRVANALSIIFKDDTTTDTIYENDHDFSESTSDNVGTSSSRANATRNNYQRVELHRGIQYPPELAPTLSPIVEFHRDRRSNTTGGGGQLTIHLQGIPEPVQPESSKRHRRRRRPQAVTLSYTGRFPAQY